MVLELLGTLARERVWIVDQGKTTFFDAQMMRELRAPETMEAAFSGRVDRLSETGRTALAIAAALGTEVDAAPEGDTWFPALDPAQWQEVARTHHAADERHAAAFDFVDYVRRLPGEQ